MGIPVRPTLCILALAAVAMAAQPPIPIPQDPTADPVPAFVGGVATPRRVHSFRVPQHPFMAPNDRSNIHDDAYQTDTYVGAGPLRRTPRVRSTPPGAPRASPPPAPPRPVAPL